MLLKAQKDFDIDMANSILIGDKASDIQAAASPKSVNPIYCQNKGES